MTPHHGEPLPFMVKLWAEGDFPLNLGCANVAREMASSTAIVRVLLPILISTE